MARFRYYHPDYRKAEVSAIVQALDGGMSVAVTGPPSVGKSNLLKFLDQDRLEPTDPNSPWKRYAPRSAELGPIITISIDPNALLPPLPDDRGQIAARSWPGFELFAHRTAIARRVFPVDLTPLNDEPDPDLIDRLARVQDKFASAHPDIIDVSDILHGHLALRYLERLIEAALEGRAMQGAPIRIAYFMDEFERLLAGMPDYFFVALRSIRDRFKEQVMFVTFTRNSLTYLVDDRIATLEPFIELFTDRQVYLGPFSDEDAWRMIENLEQRTVSQDDYGLGLLIRATGGFAGLLRAGFKHSDKLSQIQAPDYHKAVGLAASRLVAESNVQQECETLLRGLISEEINALYAASTGEGSPRPSTVRELVHKSLLAYDSAGSGSHVTPPVLAAYIRNHPTPPRARPAAPPVNTTESREL